MQGPTSIGTIGAQGPIQPFEWVLPIASQNTNSAVELNNANSNTDAYEMYGEQGMQNVMQDI